MIRLPLLLLFASTAWAQEYVLVVPGSSKISGVTELIAEATARPGELSYGGAGGGRLAGELFVRMTKIPVTQVPYKTGGAALADLLAGRLSFMFDTVASSAPHVAAGKLRAFAVVGPGRAGALPKVPTMAEAGFGGFDREFARLMKKTE